VNRLGRHLDGSRVVLGLELGEVDGGLAADKDAADEVGPVPGDPVALGVRVDNELRAPDLRKDGRRLVTHGLVLSRMLVDVGSDGKDPDRAYSQWAATWIVLTDICPPVARSARIF
jgi:hypothetical protein